jgi:predicted metal-binding membrane protein
VDASPWLQQHSQVIIGTTLLAAGLWQFSPLRDRCLDECRSPLGFVMNRWRGISERRESFAMGLAHGAFCVGCCWSLMLVMFGVGLGSVTAMLALGALTAVEKNLPWGRRLTRPLGFALVFAAIYAVAG